MNNQQRHFAEQHELFSMLSMSEICFSEDQKSNFDFLLHIDDLDDESKIMFDAEQTDQAACNDRAGNTEESKE